LTLDYGPECKVLPESTDFQLERSLTNIIEEDWNVNEHHACQHRDLHGSAPPELRDPVCGMTVRPDSPHVARHQNREYRFCSARCREKFAADPAGYLEPREAALAAAPPGAIYTCPMHPEIIREHGPAPARSAAWHWNRRCRPSTRARTRNCRLPSPLLVDPAAVADGLASRNVRPFAAGLLTPAATHLDRVALTAPVVLWAGWPFFVRWAQSIATAARTCGR
jgi:Cu+-exporting ATPase